MAMVRPHHPLGPAVLVGITSCLGYILPLAFSPVACSVCVMEGIEKKYFNPCPTRFLPYSKSMAYSKSMPYPIPALLKLCMQEELLEAKPGCPGENEGTTPSSASCAHSLLLDSVPLIKHQSLGLGPTPDPQGFHL